MSNARVYINEKTPAQYFTVIINRGFVEGIVEYCKDRGIFYARQMTVSSKKLPDEYYDEIYRLLEFLLAQDTEIYIRVNKTDEWTQITTMEDCDRYVEEKSIPDRASVMKAAYRINKTKIANEQNKSMV